ncbi:AlpA family phage regulatory protein [Burkholderia sp. Bp8977]|nr:AlpA family phage regulatory protein [Burkholderia sp. Bp9011]RQR98243.1 AlpA family phage regulatory protein [Burkholderia sp. Bp9010]RQS12775.1 AlpA family phage regulatory protein [Burkholderia sp. Bp8991]RQS81527.1 AlpA family phage regulatory protein [Burkholderia sp. Bp8977]
MKPLYLDLPAVAITLSLSEATVQKLVREREFPKPRLLSDRRVAWLTREVEAWAEACPESDLAPPPNTGHSNRRRKVTCASQDRTSQSASDDV